MVLAHRCDPQRPKQLVRFLDDSIALPPQSDPNRLLYRVSRKADVYRLSARGVRAACAPAALWPLPELTDDDRQAMNLETLTTYDVPEPSEGERFFETVVNYAAAYDVYDVYAAICGDAHRRAGWAPVPWSVLQPLDAACGYDARILRGAACHTAKRSPDRLPEPA